MLIKEHIFVPIKFIFILNEMFSNSLSLSEIYSGSTLVENTLSGLIFIAVSLISSLYPEILKTFKNKVHSLWFKSQISYFLAKRKSKVLVLNSSILAIEVLQLRETRELIEYLGWLNQHRNFLRERYYRL